MFPFSFHFQAALYSFFQTKPFEIRVSGLHARKTLWSQAPASIPPSSPPPSSSSIPLSASTHGNSSTSLLPAASSSSHPSQIDDTRAPGQPETSPAPPPKPRKKASISEKPRDNSETPNQTSLSTLSMAVEATAGATGSVEAGEGRGRQWEGAGSPVPSSGVGDQKKPSATSGTETPPASPGNKLGAFAPLTQRPTSWRRVVWLGKLFKLRFEDVSVEATAPLPSCPPPSPSPPPRLTVSAGFASFTLAATHVVHPRPLLSVDLRLRAAWIRVIAPLVNRADAGTQKAPCLVMNVEGVASGLVLEPGQARPASAYLAFQGTPCLHLDPSSLPPSLPPSPPPSPSPPPPRPPNRLPAPASFPGHHFLA
ncbi:hypothetical protein Naga_100032g1 [Nannochloropsis gaditana]|uniref:Uncharacterized protein n=1 Tax=Nannochloropsis gaditana TaxID=72520 RepID=W7TEU9_9STRA|nr:hypothetical protein Naga_100032g1 [Nannochloropsis gaditana]